MYTSLGIAAHTFVRANEVVNESKKSLKEREFDGQLLYGILKGKSIEFLGKSSKRLLNDTEWKTELADLKGLNFSLEDLGELWEE